MAMDEIDNLIIERETERQRKIDFLKSMRETEMKSSGKNKRYFYYLSAAAVLVAFIVIPMLQPTENLSDMSLSYPNFGDFRGLTIEDIETSLNNRNYDLALSIVDPLIDEVEGEIMQLGKKTVIEDEDEYNLTLAKEYYAELLWTKIYIQVKTDDKEGLKLSISKYLDCMEDPIHKEEAEEIMKKL